MKFCLKCKDQYLDSFDICPKCSSLLLIKNEELSFINEQDKSNENPIMPKVPDYLGLSIFSTLFCCVIGGIVSIIYSVKANSKKEDGKYEEAIKYSKKALRWILINAGFLLIFIFFYLLIFLFNVR